jgi:hypothetical protein
VRRSYDAQRAEALLRDGLRAAGLTELSLAGLPESDARKVALAGLLWRGTTFAQAWIAERLRMGRLREEAASALAPIPAESKSVKC